MHHALKIQEVLLYILYECDPLCGLLALARTCRAFKEPALDVLWKELDDLSPIARCLPDASCLASTEHRSYAFRRPLRESEWNVLRGYTRRIRSILGVSGLSRTSIKVLLKSPIAEPLFPNLRYLQCIYTSKVVLMSQLPFPSLDFLFVDFRTMEWSQTSLSWLSKLSQNVRNLSVYASHAELVDLNTLLYLSRLPALIELNIIVSDAQPGWTTSSNLLLCFPNLYRFALWSKSLDLISNLLSRTRLPVIADITVTVENAPSRSNLSSFASSVQACSPAHTLERLLLIQCFLSRASPVPGYPHFVLGFEDLQPRTAFDCVRQMKVDIARNSDLTDVDLLMLASAAWPHLDSQHFLVDEEVGWRMPGGRVPPDELRRALEKWSSSNRTILDEV